MSKYSKEIFKHWNNHGKLRDLLLKPYGLEVSSPGSGASTSEEDHSDLRIR